MKPSPSPAEVVTDLSHLSVLLNIKEMSKIYRVSVATIRRRLSRGTFSPRPFDKYPYLWLKSDVETDLKRRRQDQARRPHGFAANGRLRPAKASLAPQKSRSIK